MSVNSACKGLNPIITTVMLVIFFIASSFTDPPDRDLWAKQVNLMIRQIGHQLLLQAGDSTSRVLPVTEVKEGAFELSFENDLFFSHDSLIMLSEGFLPKKQFPSGYTVTVHESMKKDLVYGFQLSNVSRDIIACKGRSEPLGRYKIEIIFPDLYKNVARKENIKPKTAAIGRVPEEPKSIDPDPQVVILKPEELKTTALQSKSPITPRPGKSYSIMNLAISGMLVLLGVTLLIGRLGKILKPVPPKIQEHPALGKFLFDLKDQRLLLRDDVISLTGKECRVLELLSKNFGELIPRETLMQKIWIDEGVVTGRSLDMFVSKLRKKLSGDPDLRIKNVHGKGYKLEMA